MKNKTKLSILIFIIFLILMTQSCSNRKLPQTYDLKKYAFYWKNREYKKASNFANKMISKFPNIAIWYYYKSYFLLEKKKYKDAEKLMLTSLKVYNENKEINKNIYPLNAAYQFLSSIYLKEEKWSEAIDVLKKSILIDSTNAKTYFRLATCYNFIKDYQKALYYIDKAEHYNNGEYEKDIEETKYDIMLRTKNYSGLLSLLNSKYKKCSSDSCKRNIEAEKIIMSYKFGKFDEIINASSKLGNNYIKDDEPSYLSIKGLAHLGKKEYKKAMVDFNLSYDKSQKRILYFLEKILVYVLKHDYKNAKKYYRKLNMTKEELYASKDFKYFKEILSLYPPHLKALMDFIESQP